MFAFYFASMLFENNRGFGESVGKRSVCHFWVHTHFLRPQKAVLVLLRRDTDKACKGKYKDKYPSNFRITLETMPLPHDCEDELEHELPSQQHVEEEEEDTDEDDEETVARKYERSHNAKTGTPIGRIFFRAPASKSLQPLSQGGTGGEKDGGEASSMTTTL